jgi:hypothetical protein
MLASIHKEQSIMRQIIRGIGLGLALSLAVTSSSFAQHAWQLVSASPGVTPLLPRSENFLMTGLPWDADGSETCPPAGADDVRCEWLTQHVLGSIAHQYNGVAAAIMDGSAPQLAVFLSDVWADPVTGPAQWWIDYDVHYISLDPADSTDLRVTQQYQHNGVTQLTLTLNGPAGPNNLKFVTAPQHHWTDTPEGGANWRIRLTLNRLQTGGPAMLWVDNIHITEAGQLLFDDTFPLEIGDLNGDSIVNGVDLAMLLGAWGSCPKVAEDCLADLNYDTIVNGLDLAILLGGWG